MIVTNLLELREQLKEIYSRYEHIIIPVAKFILTLATMLCINSKIGYSSTLSGFFPTLIIALIGALIPLNCTAVILGIVMVLQMYSLSMETAIVGMALVLLMLLLYFRFSPKYAALLIITPVAYTLNIPYAIPIAAGLLCGPVAAIPVSCGLIVAHFVRFLSDNTSSIKGISEEDMASKFRFIVDGIMQNKAMIIMICAFAITLFVVYFIRRLMIAHAWTIAMIVGAVLDLLILLIGDMVADTNVSIGLLFLGTILSFAIVEGIKFFVFNLDYTRIESVQFEDDDYYYYVKAVPKVAVVTPQRTVKKINTSRTVMSHKKASRGSEAPAARQYDDEPFEDNYQDSYMEDDRDYQDEYADYNDGYEDLHQ